MALGRLLHSDTQFALRVDKSEKINASCVLSLLYKAGDGEPAKLRAKQRACFVWVRDFFADWGLDAAREVAEKSARQHVQKARG